MARTTDPPVVLIKWYDFTKWLLERIDSFPKNQRFIFGQRLADHALDVLGLLVEAAYSSRKADLLAAVTRQPGCFYAPVKLLWGTSSRHRNGNTPPALRAMTNRSRRF